MQDVYNYAPATNQFFGVYNVAVMLWLRSMIHTILFPMINALYFSINLSKPSGFFTYRQV